MKLKHLFHKKLNDTEFLRKVEADMTETCIKMSANRKRAEEYVK